MVGAAIVMLIAVSCSSGHSAADRSPTTRGQATTTSRSTTTNTTPPVSTIPATTAPPPATVVPPGPGCSTPAGTIPPGVTAGQIPDVDGDGRADQAYFAPTGGETRQLVIVTAAGGRSEAMITSASPSAASAFVANLDQKGPVEILISDNRQAYLFAYVNCAVTIVRNAQNRQYSFDLGFRGIGTGVGCAPSASGRDLVGLNITSQTATAVGWTRTVITLSGTSARAGATTAGTFVQPQDAIAISLLSTISCGDQTISENGIHQPEG
jgi:hypothetical protein